MANEEAFPLCWPDGWPRTPAYDRQTNYRFSRDLTLERARRRLYDELRLLGAQEIILSTNIPLRKDGEPYSNRRRVDDEGVAVYFKRDGRALTMAYDGWDRVEANVNSLALAVAGLRQMDRHGGATMLERAFTGFAALPPPEGATRTWADVLGFPKGTLVNSEMAESRYKELARKYHPDVTGADNSDKISELNTAIREAREAFKRLG